MAVKIFEARPLADVAGLLTMGGTSGAARDPIDVLVALARLLREVNACRRI